MVAPVSSEPAPVASVAKVPTTVSHKKTTEGTDDEMKRCFSLKAIEWKKRSGSGIDIASGADGAIWVLGS